MERQSDRNTARLGNYEYVVTETNRPAHSRSSASPCETADENDCAEWVRERMNEAYNG